MTADEIPTILPPPIWVWLKRTTYCAGCSVEIEVGQKALVFPATGNTYCKKCSARFVSKSREGKRGREYAPPACDVE